MVFNNYMLNRILPTDRTKFDSFDEFEEKVKFNLGKYGIFVPNESKEEILRKTDKFDNVEEVLRKVYEFESVEKVLRKVYEFDNDKYLKFVRNLGLDYQALKKNADTIDMILDTNDEPFPVLSQLVKIYKDRNSAVGRVISDLFFECKSSNELALAVELLSDDAKEESKFVSRCKKVYLERISQYDIINCLEEYAQELGDSNSLRRELLIHAKKRFNERMLVLKKIENQTGIDAANKTITIALREAKRRG